MPIPGRSDVVRVPRVGKIHLGVKTSNGQKEYPKATDYFVVRADESTTSQQMVDSFKRVYGENPKEITIAFPSDDPEDFFPQYLSSYKGKPPLSKLFCKGDGYTADRLQESGGYEKITCAYKDCPVYQAGQCKELGRLQFFLPEVEGIGVWQIDSTSFHTTVNLNSSIAMIRALTGGRIKMIPLTLRLVPKVVAPGGKTKTVYILDLKIENMKLMDFIQQAPMISAAFAPAVEPVQLDELPEDLYVENNMVDAVPSEEPESFISDTEEYSRAAYAGREVKSKKGSHDLVAKIRLLQPSGEVIEAITDNLTVIEDTKIFQEGIAVWFKTMPSIRWPGRVELEMIVPA